MLESQPFLAKHRDLASASHRLKLIPSLDLHDNRFSLGNISGSGYNYGTLA